ncbi:hypothetical protein RclHR1_02740002 [Rhizophagus clarus]|uniref:Uncharacterized protein n=1 Tax=Rhizophagus clarus TaxID=94130 RepID=A0A2Z6RHJ6_9GLOM|nr:hypothetical protein RclHR1_02740002 [Rhizophagus clarus]
MFLKELLEPISFEEKESDELVKCLQNKLSFYYSETCLSSNHSSFPSLGSIVIHKLLFIFYPFKSCNDIYKQKQLVGNILKRKSKLKIFKIFEGLNNIKK